MYNVNSTAIFVLRLFKIELWSQDKGEHIKFGKKFYIINVKYYIHVSKMQKRNLASMLC